jgi:NAD(P)-dependent dehydrogenase (short-subunit alcohol dehydrogenase family)
MTLSGKICLVTGATDGIGLETAKALAQGGAEVIVHGRDAAKGGRSVDAIRTAAPGAKIEFIQADFASLAQVRRMADTLNARLDKLDVLVNNAGSASFASRHLSQDGYELTFAVNHLAPFLLTNLLLEKLRRGGRARVVNVSSVAHKIKPFDIDDLMSEKIKPLYAYGRSKFANILFSNELARRGASDGIASNALHPGTVRSNFGSEATITRLFYRYAAPLLKTPAQGARTSIYLAMAAAVEGRSGGYYADCKPAAADPRTQDPQLAARLWRESEKLVGL